ncbi:hypothetical protein [Dyella sp.]|uniref:hypothetical protein n=1 Tax=Dyella sp. TaxID=1869338 RepID=UPI002FDAE854
MYCRGESTRREIVEKYKVQPIAHVKLLDGQTKKSCACAPLTDQYYCFAYESHTNPKDKGSFYCGEPTAKHFLELIKHPVLTCFNPLVSDATSGGWGGGDGSAASPSKKWHPTAKQLHDAIQLLIVAWETSPGGALLEIKNGLEKFCDREPFPGKVKAVNTIIGYDKQKRTLSQMLAELAERNRIREFHFDRLDAILAAEGIASRFTHSSPTSGC